MGKGKEAKELKTWLYLGRELLAAEG